MLQGLTGLEILIFTQASKTGQFSNRFSTTKNWFAKQTSINNRKQNNIKSITECKTKYGHILKK